MFSQQQRRRATRRSAADERLAEERSAEEERDVTNEQILEKYGLDMSLVEQNGNSTRRSYPKELQDEIIKISHQVEDVSVFAKEIGIHVGNIWQWRRKRANKIHNKGSNGDNGAAHSNGSEGLPLIATTKRARRTTASNGTATFECASVADAVAILTKLASVTSGRVSITIH